MAALNELSALGTNLTKIESRPVHGKPWEYIFYVDCQIRSSDEGSRALEALAPHCAMVKELGRYKEASLIELASARRRPENSGLSAIQNTKRGRAEARPLFLTTDPF